MSSKSILSMLILDHLISLFQMHVILFDAFKTNNKAPCRRQNGKCSNDTALCGLQLPAWSSS